LNISTDESIIHSFLLPAMAGRQVEADRQACRRKERTTTSFFYFLNPA
jgi:hypothetical protein